MNTATNTTQIQLATPEHITSLRSCAVQGAVQIRVYNGVKQDRATTNEVLISKRARSLNDGKFYKTPLGNCVEHKEIINYRAFVYGWFKRETYPWGGGAGLIPTPRIPEVLTAYDNEIKPGFWQRVDRFLDAYRTLRANYAFQNQGDLFSEDDFPPVEQVRTAFSIDLFVSDIPEGSFMNQLTEGMAEDLHRHYTRATENLLAQTQAQQLERLVDVMKSLSHCCDIEIKEGKDGETKVSRRRLHESTLHKAIQYCQTFKAFNPTNDARIEEIRTGLERALNGVSIDTLRHSDSMRAQVKSEMDDILSKFGR
jgi:hypothetical protein